MEKRILYNLRRFTLSEAFPTQFEFNLAKGQLFQGFYYKLADSETLKPEDKEIFIGKNASKKDIGLFICEMENTESYIRALSFEDCQSSFFANELSRIYYKAADINKTRQSVTNTFADGNSKTIYEYPEKVTV